MQKKNLTQGRTEHEYIICKRDGQHVDVHKLYQQSLHMIKTLTTVQNA